MKLHTADRVRSRIELVDDNKLYLSHEVQKLLGYNQSNEGRRFIENYGSNIKMISGRLGSASSTKPTIFGSNLKEALDIKARLLAQGVKTYSKAKKLALLSITNENNEGSNTGPINPRESILKWLSAQESIKAAEQSGEEENNNGSEDAL